MPCTPGTARASDRSPRRPVRVAPWPAGGRRDRVGHRVPGHWAGMAGAWAYPAGRTTEAGTSSPNAAPPGFRDPGRVPPNGRSPPGDQRSLPAAQQPVTAGWRSRMASLNRTRKEYHPARYPRERLPVTQRVLDLLARQGEKMLQEVDPQQQDQVQVRP